MTTIQASLYLLTGNAPAVGAFRGQPGRSTDTIADNASDKINISDEARQLSASGRNRKEPAMNVQPAHQYKGFMSPAAPAHGNAYAGASFEACFNGSGGAAGSAATNHCDSGAPRSLFSGGSRGQCFIQRAFGPHENEMYTVRQNGPKGSIGLDMPEFTKYRYRLAPDWYADMVDEPGKALESSQQGAREGGAPFNEEQAVALIEEYHAILGKSLGRAFDNMGVKENDWRGHGDVFQSPAKSAKLREDLIQIMNGDPRVQEILRELASTI